MARTGGIGLQLLAKVADVNAEVMIVFRMRRSPHLPQDLAMGEDLSGVSEEMGQEPVLAGGQVDRLSFSRDRPGREIDLDLPELRARRSRVAGPGPMAHRHPDPRQQLPDTERLRQVVVRSRVEGADLFRL